MLISKNAEVTWNSKNKKHYTDLGYHFTKIGDKFIANVDDLTSGSRAVIQYNCDYCNNTFDCQWYVYITKKKKCKTDKDCCANCLEFKVKESVERAFGSFANMYFASNKQRTATNIQKYGADNPFGNSEIKEKIANTNICRYGVQYTQQNKDVRSKTIQTCLEKYGVENYVELFKGKLIKENSPNWKGGIDHTRVERATYEYSNWRKEVFSRDKYTCQKCGAKNGFRKESVILHAHHILNWADNVSLRYSTENGITLCKECHTMFHSIFGKNNTTFEQLTKFLENRLDKKIC